MAVIPIIIPINSHSNSNNSEFIYFIPSYDESYINIGASSECGTYKSYGKWWIWFKINGNTKYFAHSYENKKDANDQLIKILNRLEEKNRK